MNILKMTDLDLRNKRVLIREDLNVPVKDALILSEARLKAALPTLQRALEAGASVLVLSHLGRPVEGEYSKENSLRPIAARLGEMLGVSVGFSQDYLDGITIEPGQITLCENVRFNVGEKKGSEELAKQYAALCDIFVMDAFGTAHRAQASTQAVALYAPVACAGPLLVRELEALEYAIKNPQNPVLAIIGGSKVSTKLTVLNALCKKVDTLIVGGGIANNFLKAAGHEVGRSLYEPDLVDEAKRLLELSNQGGAKIPLPLDVVVANECSPTSPSFVKDVENIGSEDMILDIGPKTSALYDKVVSDAATIMWNGPVGVFEISQFSQGTKLLGQSIAKSNAFSIAGGGDTLAAIEKYNLSSDISYLSTGGGAFLEFVEGKKLPAIAALEERFKG